VTRKKTKPRTLAAEPAANTVMVSTYITEAAKDELRRRAAREGISEAAYVRRVLCRDLGFFPQETTHG
jgi:hypothetical protein